MNKNLNPLNWTKQQQIIGGAVAIVIEKKMVSAEEISKFYAITKKTAQNRISEMKNNPIFMTGDFFRMNGRVWFPAFDEFIKQRDELKYK